MPVGLLVALELLLDRVPMQRAADPAGDVAQVADRGRSMGNPHVGVGPGTALDALQPVEHVTGVLAGAVDDLRGDLRRVGLDVAS